MSNMSRNKTLAEHNPQAFLDNTKLRQVAKEILTEVDHPAVFEIDIQYVTEALKEVYDLGRARGVHESGSGCMG